MKRFFLMLAIAAALPTMLLAENKVKHAEWFFVDKKKSNATGADFLESGRYNATAGDSAWIRFESENKIAKPDLTAKAEPICSNTQQGDCWIFEMPVENLAKGSIVDIWCPFHAYPTGRGLRFAVEYRDGKKWLPLMSTDEDGSNFRSAKISRSAHFWKSFRLQKPIKKGVVAVRVRQVENLAGASYVSRPSTSGVHPQMICYPAPEIRDTVSILFVGNSYSYCNTYPFIFKDMAMREGHYADCRMTYVGGYTMKKHMAYEPSRQAIEAGGYDYAFLQDQSYERVFTGTEHDYGSLEGMINIAAYIRTHSPKVTPIIALTWGRKHGNNHLRKEDKPLVEKYPSFFASFDSMQKRLNDVVEIEAKSIDAKIAAQGPAWQIARRERPEIELFVKDGSHPSYAGSYLAAAVSYLTIYGEPFGANPSDGRLDAETAKYLRSVAERVVLKGER